LRTLLSHLTYEDAMSQSEKAQYFRALKDAGVQFDKHYREYKTDELRAAYEKLVAAQPELGIKPEPAPAPAPPKFDFAEAARQAAAAEATRPQPPTAPVARANPNELPGQRLNSQAEDQPIRTDPDTGRVWFQEEVLKPGFPKPRGRRVLSYLDTGTETKTVKTGPKGEFMETFEVSGTGVARTAEVKITMPSYQVGICKDPRFPFKIHTYNGNEGFDLFEVQDFYKGAELVPKEIKRVYVENVLCYDIRTTVRAIQSEYRALQLAGKVK
jgi:hypothetical protein